MGSTIQFKNPDQVEVNTLKYEVDNVTTLATTVDDLVKKQNYKVGQKLNLSTKPESSTLVGKSYPPFAMSAMSPIAIQDDSATSAALPSEYHYTSANETLKGPGMATGTVTFQEPNLKVQGPRPQIGALSNDVLQSQEQSGTSLATTPSAVNLTTTGPIKQAVQDADVAHQTYSSPILAMHPFNIPPPNLVSYPWQGLSASLPPGSGQGCIPYVSTSSGNIGVPAVTQGPPIQDVSYACSSSNTRGEIGTLYPQFLTPVVTSTQPSTVVTQNERERSRKKKKCQRESSSS